MVNDSELIARQLNGLYKVKHADMKPLSTRARGPLGGFERWSIRVGPAGAERRADALVNEALDGTA